MSSSSRDWSQLNSPRVFTHVEIFPNWVETNVFRLVDFPLLCPLIQTFYSKTTPAATTHCTDALAVYAVLDNQEKPYSLEHFNLCEDLIGRWKGWCEGQQGELRVLRPTAGSIVLFQSQPFARLCCISNVLK